MTSSKKYGTGVAVGATVGALALVAASAVGAAAADGNVISPNPNSGSQVNSTVRKTVAVSADAQGKVSSATMITQVSANGKGQTTVEVPVGANSARNLDSFGGAAVQNGNAVFNLNLNGSQEARVMTTADPGPIQITTETTLDGQPIQPDQVVNKTGVLKVKYTVINKEKQVLEVPVKGKDGNTTIEKQEVDAPIGGSVAITLPQGFNEISAPGGTMGGNGMGATNLSYSLVMFRPLGNPVANLEYESRITNGTLPQAVFTMVPIVPLENSTIKTARSSFELGTKTGETINEAGKKIDDGATQLATGVGTAQAGAQKLADGLNGTAIPGAGKLAAGADQLSSGISDTLQPGANALDAGAGALAKALGDQIAPGAGQLATGAGALSTALNDQIAPGANQLATALQGAVSAANTIAAGAGNLNTAVTGLLQPGMTDLANGVQSLNDTVTGTGVNTLLAGAGQVTAGTAGAQGAVSAYDTICQGTGAPSCAALKSGLLTYIAGADGVAGGTTNLITGLQDPTAGVPALNTGAQQLKAGVNSLAAQTPALAAGTAALAGGLAAGSTGMDTLSAGIGQAASGSSALATGAGTLSAGIGQATDGSEKLSAGAGQLADGINTKVAPGAVALAEGAGQLATGLVPAGEGAQQIADGLPAAVDGAGQLAAGGKELASKGNEAAAGFGNQVNQIDAIQQLGVEGVGIPYGKATGENVTTTGAYQLTLAAAQTPEQNNAMRFGLAIVGLLAAGGIGTAITRKRKAS